MRNSTRILCFFAMIMAQKELRYVDQRQFGGIWAIGAEFRSDWYQAARARERQVEDLKESSESLPSRRASLTKRYRRSWKYTDEVLYRCGIVPTRLVIRRAEWQLSPMRFKDDEFMMIEKNRISEEAYLAEGTDYRNTPVSAGI